MLFDKFKNIPTKFVNDIDPKTLMRTGDLKEVYDWAEIDRRCKIVQDMIDSNRSE